MRVFRPDKVLQVFQSCPTGSQQLYIRYSGNTVHVGMKQYCSGKQCCQASSSTASHEKITELCQS